MGGQGSGRKPDARTNDIVTDHIAGVRQIVLARKYGVSRQRIRQIILRYIEGIPYIVQRSAASKKAWKLDAD